MHGYLTLSNALFAVPESILLSVYTVMWGGGDSVSQEERGVGVACLATHKAAAGSIPGSSQLSVHEVPLSRAPT